MDARQLIFLAILVTQLGFQPARAAATGSDSLEPPAETGQSAPSPAPGTGIDQLPPGPIGARPAEETATEQGTDGSRISPRAIAIGVGVAALLAALGGGGGGGGGSATQH